MSVVKRARLSRGAGAGKKKRLSTYQKDMEATKKAYADSWHSPPENVKMDSPEWNKWWNKVAKKRDLQWEGTSFYLPESWIDFAKIVGNYNEFEPYKVYSLLADLPVRVKLAREASVAVYVEGDPSTLKKVAKRFRGYADEINLVMIPHAVKRGKFVGLMMTPEKGETAKYLRLWFD